MAPAAVRSPLLGQETDAMLGTLGFDADAAVTGKSVAAHGLLQ